MTRDGSGECPSPLPLSYTFLVEVPSETFVDGLIDGIASVVSLLEVDQVQHVGHLWFKLFIRSKAAVWQILEAGVLRIGDQV